MEINRRVEFEWRRFADLSGDELYALLRFRQGIFVVEQTSPYPDLDGLDQTASHLLLHIDGAISGYLRLIPYPSETRVAIGRVAVAATHRGEGLAHRLMAQALQQCRRECPGWSITLSAQSYLAPFYERLGFRPTSPPYDDYGVPHIDMVLAKPVLDL